MPTVLARQNAKALRAYIAMSFSGGLDVRTSPRKLATLTKQDRLTKASNVVFDVDGSARQRWGFRVFSTDTLISTGIRGGCQFIKADGTTYNVVATVGGKVYKLDSAGAATEIATGLTSGESPAHFAQYNDVLVMTDGIDAPKKWDGTTWAALGGSSPATGEVCVVHANRMFMSKKNSSTLYWSKLNNILDWSGTSDAGFIEVGTNDGAGNIKNLLSSNQELIILKEGRTYRLQGVGPATGYVIADNLLPSTSTIGTVGTRGAVFAANAVWYVSQVGVHNLDTTAKFGDLNESFASTNIEPYFRVNTDYSLAVSPIQVAAYKLIQPILLYHAGSHHLILAAQTQTVYGGSTSGCTVLLFYNIETASWSEGYIPAAGPQEISSMWPAINQTTGEREIWMNFGANGIYAMARSQVNDYNTPVSTVTATAISSQIRHLSALGTPGLEKSARYLFMYFKRETSSTPVTVKVYYDFATTAGVTQVIDLSDNQAGPGAQGTWRIDLGSNCEFMEVDVTHSQLDRSFTWQGYEVLWRPARLVRRAVPQNNYLVNGGMETWDGGAATAPTGWGLFDNATCARIGGGSQKLGTYAARVTLTVGLGAGEIGQFITDTYTDLTIFQGRTFTFGCWVKCAVAGAASIELFDNVSVGTRPTHTGSGNWEWLQSTYTISSAMTQLSAICQVSDAIINTTADFDGAVLFVGSVAAQT